MLANVFWAIHKTIGLKCYHLHLAFTLLAPEVVTKGHLNLDLALPFFLHLNIHDMLGP